jgi:dihydropteroate synthase
MGILNATPDSFSGDGVDTDVVLAVERAMAMVAAGADIIDVGGESSRPGAFRVAESVELRRVLPVIERLSAATSIPISVDTRRPRVARTAIESGAAIINDIDGFRTPGMVRVALEGNAGLVVMERRLASPTDDIVRIVVRSLRERVTELVEAGAAPDRIVIDPGLGFGKHWRQNLEIVHRLGELRSLGRPILVGPSRKGTIGRVLGTTVDDRLEGTLAICVAAVASGASIVRVHDVREARRALDLAAALQSCRRTEAD